MELMLLVQLWTRFYGRTEAYRSQLTATLTEVRECTDPIADSWNTPCMVEWSRLYGNKRCMENHTVNSYELKSMADTCT